MFGYFVLDQTEGVGTLKVRTSVTGSTSLGTLSFDSDESQVTFREAREAW
jgi:hypothetical protein